jgi:L-threonylcarbamoyladenylate synthase
LVESTGGKQPSVADLARQLGTNSSLGLVRTKTWQRTSAGEVHESAKDRVADGLGSQETNARNADDSASPLEAMLRESAYQLKQLHAEKVVLEDAGKSFTVWDMCIGPNTASVARGLFSALRELDRKEVDAIIVEGINDEEGDIAAAVMNRLRKAAEVKLERL